MKNKKRRTVFLLGIATFFQCIILGCVNTTVVRADTFSVHEDKTSTYKKTSNIKKNVKRYTTGVSKIVGKYPKRAGVILTTSNGSIAKVVGHSAIVYSSNNIVESLEKGVCVGANNWATSKSSVAAATVRNTTVSQDKDVAQWCRKKVGKKYNFNYYSTNTREKFYCSQLVWAGFKDRCGINLNTKTYDVAGVRAIGPFEFVRKSEGDLFLVYMKNWKKNDVTD